MKKIFGALVACLISSAAFGQAQLGPGHIWGNSTAAKAPPQDATVTAILDRALASTRGAIIERGASGWQAVVPSATAGLAWISAGTGADPAYGVLGLVGGGCNAALVASNGGILYSTASACAILAGTATARLPLLSGATAAPVWGAFMLPASVTSGGVACFTSTSAMGSSALLTLNALTLGGGAGACPSAAASLGTATTVLHGNAGGAPSFSSVSLSADISGFGTGVATALGSAVSANGGVTSTIASGSTALATSAIASATCATVVTATATNTVTTDGIIANFNGDPTALTGYIPSTAGMLTIIVYPTANAVNFKNCNNTGVSITPAAITINWRVVR